MPLYIGDYLRDTTHLSAEEHGVYLLLIMTYWIKGPLPDNDKFLSAIAKLPQDLSDLDSLSASPTASLTDWRTMRSAIAPFFQIHDGFWHHKRIDHERQKRQIVQSAQAEAAKKTNARKRATHSATLSAPVSAPLSVTQPQPQPEPQPKPYSPSPPQPEPERESVMAEIPSVGEVIDFGGRWGGDMARAIPPKIPPDYCQNFFDYQQTNRKWTTPNGTVIDWQYCLVSRWAKDFRDWGKNGQGKQKPQTNSATAYALNIQREAIERQMKQLEAHGREDPTAGFVIDNPEVRAQHKLMKRKLNEIDKQLASIPT